MKVSIVTISYNQAEFLEQAIISILDQDYKDIEHIIVDAGSNDGSRRIINKYSKHFSHIILEPDCGPADGLNKGLLLATGDIFGILNADDLFENYAIKYIVDFFKDNPGIDIVSGHCIIIDQNNNSLRKSYSDKFHPLMYAYGAAELMQPSTFFSKKCYWKTNGFNTNNLSNWDSELFIDMYLTGSKFRTINKFLSYYRLHRNSITSSKKIDDKIKVFYRLRFKKIIGRDFKKTDIVLKYIFYIIKYVKNPIALFERLLKR
jgi:glycosyltransferase involved in cell wall biosynthesis